MIGTRSAIVAILAAAAVSAVRMRRPGTFAISHPLSADPDAHADGREVGEAYRSCLT